MDKIVITTTSFGKFDKRPLRLLKSKRLKVVLNPYQRKLTREEVVKLCKGATGIIAGTEILDAKVIEKLSDLKVISRCGSGLGNVDCNAAEKNGIKVFNTPDAPVLAVAELTVGLIIGLMRKINQMDAAIRKGKWEKLMGSLLCDKKVGIIGFGRIGRKVARLLRAFGSEIAYADPLVEDGLLGLKRLSREGLLRWADIITLHVSGQGKLIGWKELGLMKKGSWIINTSRGGLIDEVMLFEYLKNGRLAGAALDVFGDEPYSGRLRQLDNVLLTPHIGSYAKEARVKMEVEAAGNLLRGLGAD